MDETAVSLGMWLLENEESFFFGSIIGNLRLMLFLIIVMAMVMAQLYITYHFFINIVADTVTPIGLKQQMMRHGTMEVKSSFIANLTRL